MTITSISTARQYSLILADTGAIQSIRVHAEQQVVDDETGKQVTDPKITIDVIADLSGAGVSNDEQLAELQSRLATFVAAAAPGGAR